MPSTPSKDVDDPIHFDDDLVHSNRRKSVRYVRNDIQTTLSIRNFLGLKSSMEVKLFDDVGNRDAVVKPPKRGLRRSPKGFSLFKVTLKISNWELLPNCLLSCFNLVNCFSGNKLVFSRLRYNA